MPSDPPSIEQTPNSSLRLERPTRLDDDRITALRELFPAAFSEGRVNLEALRDELADHLDEVEPGDEHYGLNWPGKRAAKRLAAMAPSGTLAPTPGEGVDEANTQNLIIEGDNLEVLRILQKAYAGRVKLIYIDPPYNTGNDFVYKDDFKEPVEKYLEASGQADMAGLLTSNPKSSGRFHSAWLSMMYSRLVLARTFLCDDGYIVVSIDDSEVANLLLLMRMVLGEENELAVLVWDRNRKNDAKYFSVGHEYMVVFAKDEGRLKELETRLRATKEGVEDVRNEFERLRRLHSDNWDLVKEDLRLYFNVMSEDDPRKPLARYNKVDERGPYRDDGNPSWPGGSGPKYEVLHPITKKPCKIPSRGWVFSTPDRFWEEYEKGRIVFGADENRIPSIRTDLFTNTTQVMTSVHYSYAQTAAQQFDAIFDGVRVFDNPKPIKDIDGLISYLTSENDLVLDFFAGSGTTGHAVFEVNSREQSARRFVLVQLPETINTNTTTGKNAASLGFKDVFDITVERLKRVTNKLKQDGKSGDLGFRVLKLTKSNVVRLRGERATTSESLDDLIAQMQSTLVPGWKVEDVLTELMLLEGYPLDSGKTQSPDFDSNVVYSVTHPDKQTRLLVCLDDTLEEATIEQLTGLPKAERDSLDFICLDSALTDQLKARLADKLRVKTI